jgi:hypothetical protein
MISASALCPPGPPVIARQPAKKTKALAVLDVHYCLIRRDQAALEGQTDRDQVISRKLGPLCSASKFSQQISDQIVGGVTNVAHGAAFPMMRSRAAPSGPFARPWLSRLSARLIVSKSAPC